MQHFIKTLKHEQAAKAKATVRFGIAPGQQAQADWAEVARFDGRKIYAFVMVLSFSRMLYVEFTMRMDLHFVQKAVDLLEAKGTTSHHATLFA